MSEINFHLLLAQGHVRMKSQEEPDYSVTVSFGTETFTLPFRSDSPAEALDCANEYLSNLLTPEEDCDSLDEAS